MSESNKSIYVTKPSLNNISKIISDLRKINNSRQLTNRGVFHKQFEKDLSLFLNIPNVSLTCNGTLALLLAIKALDLNGEVITTPYSFIATSSVLLWSNIKPIFIDIDPLTLNIDYKLIEKRITKKTSAILITHTYGNPCNFSEIKKIAKKYGLKIIYDGAAAFGVNDSEGSILRHGDISITSFHATKVLTTIEGGAIFTKNKLLKKKIDLMINFGFKNEFEISELGLNLKMNEFQAICGIHNLHNYRKDLNKREKINNYYRKRLGNLKGIRLFNHQAGSSSNYSYFPIINTNNKIDSIKFLYDELKNKEIHARRYFYPIIPEYSIFKKIANKKIDYPVANQISKNILCLPIYKDLNLKDVDRICNSVIEIVKKRY